MAFGPSHWREARRKNPLSHTVVVCDEAHNIVQPPDDIFNKLQVKNVQRFGVKINGKPPPVRAPRNNHECVQPKSKCKRTVASYEHTAFYYAAWKSKGLTLANALELAPKLFHIAKEVHDDPEARKT
jgi:hypothetical protein